MKVKREKEKEKNKTTKGSIFTESPRTKRAGEREERYKEINKFDILNFNSIVNL
jgi:hypothetical protein